MRPLSHTHTLSLPLPRPPCCLSPSTFGTKRGEEKERRLPKKLREASIFSEMSEMLPLCTEHAHADESPCKCHPFRIFSNANVYKRMSKMTRNCARYSFIRRGTRLAKSEREIASIEACACCVPALGTRQWWHRQALIGHRKTLRFLLRRAAAAAVLGDRIVRGYFCLYFCVCGTVSGQRGHGEGREEIRR